MKQAVALILPVVLLAYACANRTSPDGGPKDETPPKLLRSSPDSNQRNFRGRNIELTFNEMLQLNNPKEEIIITPPVGSKTEFNLKDNHVTIEPEFDLRSNTTYTINFREGIKDITEGNIAEDLHLAFSTGPDLDSLVIEGTVKLAISETIPENITVAIYQADTFNIMLHSPEYFTKSTKTGTFRLTNLKPGTYRIYAFHDKNKNLRVDSQSEKFGFLSKPLQLTSNVSKLSIALVNIDTRPLKLTSVRNQSTANTIRLNKPAKQYTIRSSPRVLTTFGADNTEIIAHYPAINTDRPSDSLYVSFVATDSVEQRIDTTIYIKRDGREKIKEAFKTTTTEPSFNTVSKRLEFSIKFNKPLRSMNIDSLYLKSDTATVVPLNLSAFRLDTVHNELRYTQDLTLQDSLITPKLRVGPGFLISIDSDSSKAETRTVNVLTPETTAALIVHVQTKLPNYIVQVIDPGGKVVASAVNNPKPVFRYLQPQTFRVRVVVDENANGLWDTANYLQNREPERVVYYLNSDKKSEIPLRANWEVGPNVIKL